MNIQYKDTIEEIKKKPYIESVVDLLKGCNYRMVHMDFIKEHKVFKKLNLAKAHRRYQFLVRMTHIDKNNPVNDIYDFKFMVGIRFYDIRSPFIPIYYKGELVETIKMPWNVTMTQNMKKKKVPLKFPDPMSIQDRIDWRKTHKKFTEGKEIKPKDLEYYLRWKPEIENIDKEKLHLE